MQSMACNAVKHMQRCRLLFCCVLACEAQAGQHLLQQRRGVGQQLLGRQLHQGVQPPERGQLRRWVVPPLLQLLRQDEGDLADVRRTAAAAAGLDLQQKLLQALWR